MIYIYIILTIFILIPLETRSKIRSHFYLILVSTLLSITVRKREDVLQTGDQAYIWCVEIWSFGIGLMMRCCVAMFWHTEEYFILTSCTWTHEKLTFTRDKTNLVVLIYISFHTSRVNLKKQNRLISSTAYSACFEFISPPSRKWGKQFELFTLGGTWLTPRLRITRLLVKGITFSVGMSRMIKTR